MGRTLFFVGTVATLLAVEPVARGFDKRADKQSELMKRKLMESQKVLEGIAVNDFDKIAKHAEELLLISKTAEWRVFKTPEYELFSNSFQRNANDLIKNAKAKNLDAAALSYVDLTLTCVKCHKYVREERKTSLEDPFH